MRCAARLLLRRRSRRWHASECFVTEAGKMGCGAHCWARDHFKSGNLMPKGWPPCWSRTPVSLTIVLRSCTWLRGRRSKG